MVDSIRQMTVFHRQIFRALTAEHAAAYEPAVKKGTSTAEQLPAKLLPGTWTDTSSICAHLAAQQCPKLFFSKLPSVSGLAAPAGDLWVRPEAGCRLRQSLC